MTIELFREDGYLKECAAKVVSTSEQGVQFDQTVFYPMGGGQPGDQGVVIREDGSEVQIIDTLKDRETGRWHILEAGATLQVGEPVRLELDWERRYQIMRLHSAMHMLCAVVPAPVTGGSIRDTGSARLDFDLPEPPDKLALQSSLNKLTTADHPMSLQWISDEEMEAQPELVRTMSVKPPMGTGKVRLVNFEGADLQPCGGTHVANTQEIGSVIINSIKKKGKQNRRITISLA